MFVKMQQTVGTTKGSYLFRHIYDVEPETAAEWQRKGLAIASEEPPDEIKVLLNRLDDGAGQPCLFLPFIGEFGHEILTHIRIVHFHRASEKVVCCRPGNEVLYPSAKSFITNWTDPINDLQRVGTFRENAPAWPQLLKVSETLGCKPLAAGGLTFPQEMFCIEPDKRIPFRPKLRGLRADVVFGIRQRAFAPEKNWQHWQRVADAVAAAGYTFAVIGAKETSYALQGQVVHSGDLDTDAAVELLQKARLYVGTDSGGSHLAATVGLPMLVFREPRNGMRTFVPRMRQSNPNLEFLTEGWDDAAAVSDRTVAILRAGPTPDPTEAMQASGTIGAPMESESACHNAVEAEQNRESAEDASSNVIPHERTRSPNDRTPAWISSSERSSSG